MHTRSRLVAAGLVVGLLVAGIVAAQDRPPKLPRTQSAHADSPDQRLAELEATLTRALKEVQALRGEMKTPAPPAQGRHEVRIFMLKNAEARQTAKLLNDIYGGRDDKEMTVGCDERTNALILNATAERLAEVEAIISRLDSIEAELPKEKKK
jgi:type II secretory pathway component GspD/PulD (secretin)